MNGNLSTKKLSLESLSTYRNVLMGLEILLIIIFHFTEDCRLYDVRYGGWVEWFDIYIHSSGVDMFLLLSGMGLYFSMKKGTGQKAFYRKRFEKILIPYVIVAVPAWFWLDLIQEKNGILAFLAGICYLIFPYVFRLADQARDTLEEKMRIIVLCLMTTTALVLLELYHHDLYVNISIAVSRFPAFFTGALIGKAVYEKRSIPRMAVIAMTAGAVAFAGPLGLADKSIIGVYMAAFVNLSLCLLLVMGLDALSRGKRSWARYTERGICRVLGWFGKYTIELYLIHVAVRRIMKTLGFYTYRFSWEAVMIIISIVLALVLSRVTGWIQKRIQ